MAGSSSKLLGSSDDDGSRSNKLLKVFTIILALLTAGGIAGVIILLLFYLGTQSDLKARESDVARATTLLKNTVCSNILNEKFSFKEYQNMIALPDGSALVITASELLNIGPTCGVLWRTSPPAGFAYGPVAVSLPNQGVYVQTLKDGAEYVLYIDNKGSPRIPRATEKHIVQIISKFDDTYSVLSVANGASNFTTYAADTSTTTFTNFTATNVVAKEETYYVSGKLDQEGNKRLAVYNGSNNSDPVYIVGVNWNQDLLLANDKGLFLLYSTSENITIEKLDPENHKGIQVFADSNVNTHYECKQTPWLNYWCTFGKGTQSSLYDFSPDFTQKTVLGLGNGQPLYLSLQPPTRAALLIGDKGRGVGTTQTFMELSNNRAEVAKQSHIIGGHALIGVQPGREKEFCALLSEVDAWTGYIRLFPHKFTLDDFTTYCR